MRVLVVEDDWAVAKAYELVFRDRAELHLCADGQEARELLRTHSYGLVISDYLLSGTTDGARILEYAAAYQPGARRVLITGARLDPLQLRALRDANPAVDDILIKPVARPALVALLTDTGNP